MLYILNAAYLADAEHWLATKLKTDFVAGTIDPSLDKGFCKIQLDGITQLSQILQPQDDLFGDDNVDAGRPQLISLSQAVVFSSEELQVLSHISRLELGHDVYLYFSQVEFGAVIKKTLE